MSLDHCYRLNVYAPRICILKPKSPEWWYLVFGNGTFWRALHPLQYSCPEDPVDRGAWRAAVHGVAQSRTRLKRLSSSSSSPHEWNYCPQKRDSRELLSFFTTRGHSKKTVGCNSGRGLSPDAKSAGTLILRFPHSRRWGMSVCAL